MFALIYHSPGALVSTGVYLAVLVVAAALAGFTYRRQVVSWHRRRPRSAVAILAVVLAIVIATSGEAIVPVPACMADSWAEVSIWCKILDWLY